MTQSGKDKLGRWTWMKLQGKNSRIVTIVSVYRPVVSKEPGSVFNQQLQHFQSQSTRDTFGKITNPRDQFWIDLHVILKDFYDKGEKIILGMDCNEDVRNTTIRTFFNKIGMREAITNKHHQVPETYFRNYSNQPIDGIFVSEEIEIINAGFTSYHETGWSDHRALWIDINYHDLFLHAPDNLIYQQPKRLTADIPSRVKKYLNLVHKSFSQHQVIKRSQELHDSMIAEQWTNEKEKEFNTLHALKIKLRKEAEKKVRKLKMGKFQWSPEIDQLWDRQILWNYLKKAHEGKKASKKFITRLAK